MDIILISGPRDSGKTAFLRSLADSGGWGCLAPKAFDGDGVFQGYDLQVFPEGLTYPLARLSGSDSPRREISRSTGSDGEAGFSYGPFLFRSEPFLAMKARTSEGSSFESSLLFLDEIGPVEMAGEGLAPTLKILLSQGLSAANDCLLYLSVRPDLIDDVQSRFSFRAARIIGL
ncbi:MAG: hypothetical protein JXA95_18380 [Spirochaetales bacterium]|nr:hypothetical protein [Spirochaetales bacterium]